MSDSIEYEDRTFVIKKYKTHPGDIVWVLRDNKMYQGEAIETYRSDGDWREKVHIQLWGTKKGGPPQWCTRHHDEIYEISNVPTVNIASKLTYSEEVAQREKTEEWFNKLSPQEQQRVNNICSGSDVEEGI